MLILHCSDIICNEKHLYNVARRLISFAKVPLDHSVPIRMASPFKLYAVLAAAVFVITSLLTWYIHEEWRLALMKRRGMEEDAMEIAMSTVVKVRV